MAASSFVVKNGLVLLFPLSGTPSGLRKGDLYVDDADGLLINYDGSTSRKIVNTTSTQTLTNKTISSDANTITIDGDTATVLDLALTSLKTNLSDASKFLQRNASGVVVSDSKAVPTGTVVGTTDSQTLTNKVIDSANNTITIDGDEATVEDLALTSLKTNLSDASKFLNRDASGIVVSSAKAIPSGVVVGTTDSQTLSNKVIDGDDNTVQDLALTSLKTNFSDASKFLVRDASGIPVSNTKAVPTGVVVGTTDTQTLTAKTLTAPIQSSYEEFTEISAPSTPSANKVRVYAKADGLIYSKDDAGVETALASVPTASVAKAWVNFDGTPGTPTIRSSYNVSGIVKNSSGDFTITYSTTLASANVVLSGSARENTTRQLIVSPSHAVSSPFTTTTCRIFVGNDSGAATDGDVICLVINGT